MKAGSWVSILSMFLFGVAGAATVSKLIPLGADLTAAFGLDAAQFGWLISLVALQYGEMWRKLPPGDYLRTKYEQGELLMQLIETVFPRLREHIEELEVATPLTMMRYLNTPGGAIYGFQQSAQDSALLRERLDAVPGLYMAGSWTSMGGFQPTYMAGESTARAVLKQIKVKEVANV